MKLDTQIQSDIPVWAHKTPEVENQTQYAGGAILDFTKIAITRPNIHRFS